MYVPDTHGDKKALNSLGLQLKIIVSFHVSAGNQTCVLCESSCGFNFWAISLASLDTV